MDELIKNECFNKQINKCKNMLLKKIRTMLGLGETKRTFHAE